MTKSCSLIIEHDYVAVIDIGKTNCKVVIVDKSSLKEVAYLKTANISFYNGDYVQFNLDAMWEFIVDSFTKLYKDYPFNSISVTAHGASIVMLGEDDLSLPMLDYEDKAIDEIAEEYNAIRPKFSETYSARLPHGQNPGTQIYWFKTKFPEKFKKTKSIITYPQYWVWKLTGKRVIEITSFGAHTDLWNPIEEKMSGLVDKLEIRDLIPPLHSAFDEIGILKPELAKKMGIEKDVRVFCGIHDSNSSVLPHLLYKKDPFTLLSTGTWVVGFATSAILDSLDEKRDSYANINAFGKPLATSRYMGGREFDILNGTNGVTEFDQSVIDQNIMAWPSFSGRCGPYPNMQGRITHPLETLTSSQRYTLTSLYSALMCFESLKLIHSDAPIILEGPFAHNEILSSALSTLTKQDVYCSQAKTGTAIGAALLTGYNQEVLVNYFNDYKKVKPLPQLSSSYVQKWLRELHNTKIVPEPA